MSTLTLWNRRDPFAAFDPFADFDAAFARLARRRAVGPAFATRHAGVSRPAFVPAAELARDGDDAVVRLELPGVDVDNDVAVEVDGGRLVVKGEKRSENTAGTWREVRYGRFERSFALPEHVTGDAVTAEYASGVLTVRVAGAYTSPEPTAPSAHRVAITTGTTPAVDAPATEATEVEGDTPEA
jgi:HSP20 family protein